MNRLILSIMLLGLIAGATACSNEASARSNGAIAGEAELPEDVRELAAEIRSGAAEPAPEQAATSGVYETTGEIVSPSQSTVAPKVPGIVARVHAEEGQIVRRGEPLASLDVSYLTLDVRRAEAELSRARAAEADAARDLERKKGLRATDSIPQALYDRTLASAEQATAAREAAEAALALTKQRLADSVIRSPLTGVVAERRVDVGEHIGEGGIAFVVNQTSPLRLRFAVPERHLNHLTAGQAVVARVDPYPGESFAGRIRIVGGVVNPSSRTIVAEAELPNEDDRLRPGLFARVSLDLTHTGAPAAEASTSWALQR